MKLITKEAQFRINQGQLLRKARKQANLTQSQVASHFEMSQDAISTYEKGKTAASPYQLLEFSRLYSKPITFFYMVDINQPGSKQPEQRHL